MYIELGLGEHRVCINTKLVMYAMPWNDDKTLIHFVHNKSITVEEKFSDVCLALELEDIEDD